MARKSAGEPTVKAIAELAKTSPSTASRVLAGYPHVRDDVRMRVLKAAETLQYRVVRPSRSVTTTAGESMLAPGYSVRLDTEGPNKARIGRYVAERWVRNGDVIVLDSGTTVQEVARYLTVSPIVYTYSIPLLDLLSLRGIPVFCAPGRYDRVDACNVGDLAEAFFRKLKVHRAFLGCHKFDVQAGPCNLHDGMDRIRRAIVEAADEVILLVDHSKFTDAELPPFMPVDGIRAVITDSVPERFRDALAGRVQVVEVDAVEADDAVTVGN